MPLITRTKEGAANFGPWENVVRVLILVWFVLYTLNAIPDVHPMVGRIAGKVNNWISYFFVLNTFCGYCAPSRAGCMCSAAWGFWISLSACRS